MSIRRLFVSVLVTFAVIPSVASGYLAWREASRALDDELDQQAALVPGAAVETGLQASVVIGLEPGFEDLTAWQSTHAKLQRLLRYVREAYLVAPNNTALVSSLPADSVPIGMPLRFLEAYTQEMDSARAWGSATTQAFVGSDGQLYKWGFSELEDSGVLLAVLMPADYLSPLAALRRNLIVVTAIAAVLAALLAALLAARITEPVERLSRVALRIQRGRMNRPVELERGVELGRLSRAMERMRQGIQERDEQLRLMLAQVAHEIRNPLGGVELFASAATETDDPEERRHLMSRVRAEVSALNTIIDDFLAYARPLSPNREPSDLRRPLLDAAELARAEVERREGTLEVNVPDEPLLARVGADHVKRAVLNLLRNAAHVASRVELKAWARGREIVIAVADDGPGVPRELRDRIFEPFVTDKEQGAGLGLAIVRKVAEANGGRVELARTAETDGARGSEFRIYFENLGDESPPTA